MKLSGKDFRAAMAEIDDQSDPECSHLDADALLVRVLNERGGAWAEGAAIFDAMRKWYA